MTKAGKQEEAGQVESMGKKIVNRVSGAKLKKTILFED
jgi:hypothetical protein